MASVTVYLLRSLGPRDPGCFVHVNCAGYFARWTFDPREGWIVASEFNQRMRDDLVALPMWR